MKTFAALTAAAWMIIGTNGASNAGFLEENLDDFIATLDARIDKIAEAGRVPDDWKNLSKSATVVAIAQPVCGLKVRLDQFGAALSFLNLLDTGTKEGAVSLQIYGKITLHQLLQKEMLCKYVALKLPTARL